MPTGYDYQATQNIYIPGPGGSRVLAFATGDLVPDTTVTANGWVALGWVQAIGTPGPSITSVFAQSGVEYPPGSKTLAGTYMPIPVDHGAWVTSTAYITGDVVTNGVLRYSCVLAHTSGTFATDLTAGKWVALTVDLSATYALVAEPVAVGVQTNLTAEAATARAAEATKMPYINPQTAAASAVITLVAAQVANVNATSRIDAACATTNGSATVTDTSITAADLGKAVTGTGVPANTYVGTVTVGASFLLSSTIGSQTNVNATATNNPVSLTIGGSIQTKLPTGATSGQTCVVRNVGSGGLVKVIVQSTDTIDGTTAPAYVPTGSSVSLVSNGAGNWTALHGRRQTNDVRNYGAIGDFVSHPLSQRFATLAAAQAVYPEATSLSDEIDWAAITRCIAANGSVYLSPDGAGNKTFVIGNGKSIDTSAVGGVYMYGDSQATLIIQTTANTPVLIMANSGNTVRSLSVGYVSQRASTETNSICIYLAGGSGGGSFYNSTFVNVKTQYGAYGWKNQLSPAGTAVFSVAWRDCEVQNFSICGFSIDTSYGMTSNRVDNLYIHNNTAGSGHSATRGVATVGGFHAQGWQSGAIDNVNVEHLTAPYMMTIDSCPGTSLRSFYTENCEINADNSGILKLMATNTGVPVVGSSATVTGMSVAYGQFLTASGCTNFGLVYLDQGTKLQLESIQAHDNTITAANPNVVFSNVATTASVYVTDATVDAGFAQYNSGIAGQIKRYGDVWNTQTAAAASTPSLLAAGEATFDPRLAISASGTGATQRLHLTYFTAIRTESCTQIAVCTHSSAAGATPTLVQIAVYSVDASDNLTLVASTPNDTTLFATASTRYVKSFSAAFTKTAGQRYAVGILIVTAAAIPTLMGNIPMNGTGLGAVSTLPRRQGRVASQTSLPSTITAGTVTLDGGGIYVEVLP